MKIRLLPGKNVPVLVELTASSSKTQQHLYQTTRPHILDEKIKIIITQTALKPSIYRRYYWVKENFYFGR